MHSSPPLMRGRASYQLIWVAPADALSDMPRTCLGHIDRRESPKSVWAGCDTLGAQIGPVKVRPLPGSSSVEPSYHGLSDAPDSQGISK